MGFECTLRRCTELATGEASLPDQTGPGGAPVCTDHTAEVRRHGYTVHPLDAEE